MYITAAKAHPPIKSVMLCCFKNKVDKHISTQITSEHTRTALWFFKASHLLRAMCMTTELYTWMLGNTLYGISTSYSEATSVPNILSGSVSGRRLSPLG